MRLLHLYRQYITSNGFFAFVKVGIVRSKGRVLSNVERFKKKTGAIIGDGDRTVLGYAPTPWYGTIFLFLEQIAPSWLHIFALIHARVVGSRVYVVTLHDEKLWELRVFTAKAGNKSREELPGLFYALLRSELMEKVSFSGSKISLISRFEWMISARACCTRK